MLIQCASVTNLPSSKPGLNLESSAVTNGEDVEMKDAGANGASANKRKARQTNGKTQSHAEPQSSEDDKPLVYLFLFYLDEGKRTYS